MSTNRRCCRLGLRFTILDIYYCNVSLLLLPAYMPILLPMLKTRSLSSSSDNEPPRLHRNTLHPLLVMTP